MAAHTGDLEIRPVTAGDFSTCQRIFDVSFADLHRRSGLEDGEADGGEWLAPILGHFGATDPSGQVLGTVAGEPVAFAASVRRDGFWFLSFLFVLPKFQGRGVGRSVLRQIVPGDVGVARATVVESFQAISTGLYARFGMSPRAVKYWVSGCDAVEPPPQLAGLRRSPMSATDSEDVDALDRALLGFARRVDHQWWHSSGQRAWCYRRDDRLLAYAYVDDTFVGPALAIDESVLCAVVADAIRDAAEPKAMAVNVCGESGSLLAMLMNAGGRIDDSTPYRFVYCASEATLGPNYLHHADWLP